MASETPDPSSSELLTDFDIADVDNWDDQNDTSKDMELMKSADPYVPSTSIHTLQSPIQGHLPGQQMPMKASIQSGMSSMDDLKSFQSLLVKQRPQLQNQPSITSQQQAVGHDYAKIHNHSQRMLDNTKQNPTIPEKESQRIEPTQQKTIQSGQALETLRALALAQEEQARKVKQDQEKAAQLQQQLKLVTSAPQQIETANSKTIPSPTTAILGMQQPSTAAKPPQLPITTLKLPITDPKGQGGKPNSVVQLRGQLVRTPDQKLMLVTELAGKKVGYLIGSQAGQLQTTNITAASQLIAKANQGTGPVHQKTQQVTAMPVPSPISTTQNNVSTAEERTITEEPKTILDSVDENSNDSSRQACAKDSITVSSDDDSGSLVDVSLGLKNTTLDGGISSGLKKRKIKAKKKKDKNEPVKPISPYLMFLKDTQPYVRQQNPGASLGEASKMVSKLWEQLGKEEKQVYLDRSAKAKEEYQLKLAEYRASIAVPAASPAEQPPITDDANGNSLSNATALDVDASPTKCDAKSIAGDNGKSDTIVVSSSDSSPEESLKNRLGSSRMTDSTVVGTEQETAMDVDAAISNRSQSEGFHSDISSPDEEPVVRKRGRPKLSKNKKPPLRLPKGKRGRKVEKVETPETEKPLKLTMKINIKDSKITESPTRAFAEVESSMVVERLPDDDDDDDYNDNNGNNDNDDNDDEEMVEKEADEIKPSTQPKALLGFKIPKKQRPSTEDVKKETSDGLSKPSQPGFRKCSRPNCEKAAKINKERGPSYCSNKCLVLHCRNVFDTWVDERKKYP